MAKYSDYLVSWFLFLLLLQIETGINGSNAESATSMGVIKLRIGVPKKDGFTQFVNVLWKQRENKYNVSGYCIDVFNAVMKVLPLNVSPEFEPYVNETGHSAGTYDSLVQQIPENKYDAVVGDVTIVANRSNFVDFTLPYTESDVCMLVPIQHGKHSSMWIFVRPFAWDLWLCIVILNIFTGLVIHIMERNAHNVSADGSPIRKDLRIVTILWFPLAQAVLPEREVVVKTCSRFVLMVWLLLAFVLMQSYTANLTSILTLDQLQPSYLKVIDLKKKGYYVGYQTDSFVQGLLVQRLKFDPSKLRAYSNISEYHHALKLGSEGGGVAAIFDELPYLKVFLKKFGSNYMMAGATYRTDGFGFAFPRNSNLTSYFSRAILNVTESDIMDEIEHKYFGKDDGVQDQSGSISSDTPSLTSRSFAGLFLITGIATLLALAISESVTLQKPILMARHYSQRYFGNWRSSRVRDDSTTETGRDVGSSSKN
ncbi:hypothetical protein L6164_011604 [Bauhinia variegata]|uniref:Uncharacterized protein n=1 Tax=Bauhinia variegata TaxID=167791 RepID=A0ACB9P7G9_BAUVA|nr:hypothetical protein L6164_011604 [Bauhinia variegata]